MFYVAEVVEGLECIYTIVYTGGYMCIHERFTAVRKSEARLLVRGAGLKVNLTCIGRRYLRLVAVYRSTR